ncbi:diaminopimelate epimerase [Legionella spiritensis]|uniref:diaminopimelate epimerase n=1 Tax=Legionella spiritensis TaxID=452 RepID=UPI000F6C116F|nr:diaminopimelate epimerase [Legionella spiritensis]
MPLKFTKMHGLGNDFMVIDAIHQTVDLSPQTIVRLANRHTGVGFDQCLIVETDQREDIDFFYRIFNADGQEVGQCGNGARCLARFVQKHALISERRIRVATHTAMMTLQLNDDNTVTVDMGIPRLHPDEIPIQVKEQSTSYILPLNAGGQYTVHAVNVGNPHAVSIVEDINTAPVTTLGREISEHPLFPVQANAGFMQILAPHRIRLRVYERGCGETSACGSGAVAAVVAGRLFYDLAERVHVELPGGELIVDWPDVSGALLLTGPATFVYEGELLPCVS